MSVGARAAARLVEERESLARAVTDALYAAHPRLLERYGSAGRDKCLQDMRYNVEHLAPAVELDSPEMFADYARWLDALLRARDVPTADVVRCLELLSAEVLGRFPVPEGRAIARCLEAGLAALGPGPAAA